MTGLYISAPGQEFLRLAAEPGQMLSAAIWLSGRIQPRPLCNGLGLCGRCHVRYLDGAPKPCQAEDEIFSAAQLAAGWRLACRHTVAAAGETRLELPDLALPQAPPAPPAPAACHAFLGVDLGTTTIEWQITAQDNKPLAAGSLWNPQAGAGPDVISRLRYAQNPAGRRRLSRLAREAIADMAARAASRGVAIQRACVAGNSAMTEILLDMDISGLAAAPYALSFTGGATLDLDLPGIGPLPTCFPPLPAPFVGGDITAGLLALLERGAKPPFLLADLGTNAELAILDAAGRLYLASAPLGPAMEGIGPRCGQPAGPGVITAFQPGPAGFTPQIMPPATDCAGISATGYISLLAHLLNFGIMDQDGRLNPAPAMPLAQKMAQGLARGLLPLPRGQYLTAADIEMLLKVKAALSVAITAICQKAALPAQDFSTFYLAGALGLHADTGQLAVLGFLPQALAARTIACGNIALAGACLLAAQPEKLDALARLSARAIIIDLANDPHFLDAYLAAMRWG